MESVKEQQQKHQNINDIELDENNEIFIEQINIDPKRDIYDKLQLQKMEQINKNKQQQINTNSDGLYQFDQKNSENLVNFSGNSQDKQDNQNNHNLQIQNNNINNNNNAYFSQQQPLQFVMGEKIEQNKNQKQTQNQHLNQNNNNPVNANILQQEPQFNKIFQMNHFSRMVRRLQWYSLILGFFSLLSLILSVIDGAGYRICNFAAFKGKKFIVSKQQVHLTQFQKKLKITFFISFLTFVCVLISLIATLKWISDEEKRTDEVLNGYYYDRRILSSDVDFQSLQNNQNLDFNSQLNVFNFISEPLNTKNVQKITNLNDKRQLSQQNKKDDYYDGQQDSHYYDYNYDDENEYYSKEDLKGYRIYSFILFAIYILFELMFVCFKNKILKISNELIEKEQQQQLPNQYQQNVQINLNDPER